MYSTIFLRMAVVVVIAAQVGVVQAQKVGQPLEPAAGTTEAPSVAPSVAPVSGGDVLALLATAEEARGFTEFLASAPDGVTADTIGHLMFVRRHFDKAAWFFGTEALANPDDAASLNNFSTMLVQTYSDPGGAGSQALLEAAYAASTQAVNLYSDTAAFQNNLGNAARLMQRFDEAVAAAERAVERSPDVPLYWANLARARAAAGDDAGAAEALARAHALSPNGMAVAAARRDLPSGGPYQGAIQRNCEVNFRCQEICPRSIIGGLMSVTCEMENSSAQLACMEGKPFPITYDCREDLPEYGILIPGLNSGFSIAVPGFSAHVVVDGQGNVDVRVEAGVNVGPIGGYVRADGHYSPTGGISYDNLGGGVRVSVLPSSSAGNLAGGLGHPPAHIEVESVGGQPASVNVEMYNTGVISG